MLICKTNLHTKIKPLSSLQPEKIMFPPKPDRKTDIRTDISIYRVASLLKRYTQKVMDSILGSNNVIAKEIKSLPIAALSDVQN